MCRWQHTKVPQTLVQRIRVPIPSTLSMLFGFKQFNWIQYLLFHCDKKQDSKQKRPTVKENKTAHRFE